MAELISPAYATLNKQLHALRKEYGLSGHQHADMVAFLAKGLGETKILDYGSGKMSLNQSLPMFDIFNYDPGYEGCEERPEPAPIVACTDVMEHIEPDKIEAVLQDIAVLCQKAVFFVISTVPAKKTLPDGRNTHLTVQPVEWWLPYLLAHWKPVSVITMLNTFIFVGYTYEYFEEHLNKPQPASVINSLPKEDVISVQA